MSTRSSLAFSFLDRYASLAVGIVATMLLARLLTPAEVGVYSVAMALLALAATVRDMGAGNYLLQEKELTTDRIRAVWAVQLGLGTALALLVAGLSQPAAWFYDEPRMRDILLLLALTYLINPFGSLTYAALMRDMRYDAVAVMRFSSSLSGALVSVWLAWRGHGPISLAWGSLCATAVNAGVATLFRPKHFPWLPGLKELRRVLGFGTRLTSASIMNSVATAAPEFLLGKMQSLAAAAYFSRANGLVNLFSRLVTDAVYPVALSLFSRESREGKALAEPFLRSLSYITVLSWSFCLTLVFVAHPAVRVLYGPQWDESVALTRWLAACMALISPVPLCTAALIGTGNVKLVVKATSWSAGATVCAAVTGSMFGLQALGMGLLLAACVSAVSWLHAAQGCLKFSRRGLMASSARSALVATCAASPAAAVMLHSGTQPELPVPSLGIAGFGFAAAFLLSIFVSKHPLRMELRNLVAIAAARARTANRG